MQVRVEAVEITLVTDDGVLVQGGRGGVGRNAWIQGQVLKVGPSGSLMDWMREVREKEEPGMQWRILAIS